MENHLFSSGPLPFKDKDTTFKKQDSGFGEEEDDSSEVEMRPRNETSEEKDHNHGEYD